MASEGAASIWKLEDECPLMTQRSDTRSPLEVEEVGSSSGKGVGEIEGDWVSSSVSPAEPEAAKAPSRSDVEQVNTRSRL